MIALRAKSVVAGWRDTAHRRRMHAAGRIRTRYYLPNAVHIDRKPIRTHCRGVGRAPRLASHQRGGPAFEVLVPRDAFEPIAACNWTEIGMAAIARCAVLEGANRRALLMAKFLISGASCRI